MVCFPINEETALSKKVECGKVLWYSKAQRVSNERIRLKNVQNIGSGARI